MAGAAGQRGCSGGCVATAAMEPPDHCSGAWLSLGLCGQAYGRCVLRPAGAWAAGVASSIADAWQQKCQGSTASRNVLDSKCSQTMDDRDCGPVI